MRFSALKYSQVPCSGKDPSGLNCQNNDDLDLALCHAELSFKDIEEKGGDIENMMPDVRLYLFLENSGDRFD